jgi:hypothetical protein
MLINFYWYEFASLKDNDHISVPVEASISLTDSCPILLLDVGGEEY